MDRESFLNSFREALLGKVPDDIIQDNVNYYSRYIDAQMRGGKSEAQVLSELGDPRLLAHTIEDSTKYAQGDYRETADAYDTVQDTQEEQGHTHLINRLPTWLTAILLVIVFAFVIVAVFSLLSFFAPLILLVLFAMLIGNAVHAWRSDY